jgi:hypothetical protein
MTKIEITERKREERSNGTEVKVVFNSNVHGVEVKRNIEKVVKNDSRI